MRDAATDGFGHAQLGGLAAMLADVVKNEITGLTGSLVEGVYGRAGAISPSFPKALSIQCAMAKTTGRLCT